MKPLAILIVLGMLAPAGASAGQYDAKRAGHPLRIVAYVLHPVGVILDRLIFRPAWHLGGHEPIRTLVGREPNLDELDAAPELKPEG